MTLPFATPPRPLAEILVERRIISPDQLRIAEQEQARSRQQLGKLLIELGFVTEATLRDALSESLGQSSVDLAEAVADPAALRLIPHAAAIRHRLLPLAFDQERQRLTVATADGGDLLALDQIRAQMPPGIDIDAVLAGEAEIAGAIDRSYGHELSIDGILKEIEHGTLVPGAHARPDDDHAQPVVRLIDALLADAVKRDASDIHFEPESGFLRIRYRIDGMLRQIRALHKSYWPAMAVRLKVISGMNIAETRAAQDGSCQRSLAGRRIDFRVAVQPTIHGENIVLRILDRQKGIVPLDRLGLDDAHIRQLQRMISRPHGLVLVTGPTGSGKTTTLYSLLAHLNSESVNIMTLEDPVEYPMPMLRQTSVSDAAKVGFANGIRSLMRQDPDVILVGEIRDSETAEMAFRASMTGHQVYSTLHSNSALGAIPRLLDIGVPPELISGNVVGIVAQRLLRRLCPQCRRAQRADTDECRLLGVPAGAAAPLTWHPTGCPACDFQGYRGRMAIIELVRMDRTMDDLIARRAPMQALHAHAIASGLMPLADDGIRHVLAGSTSLAEVMRVVDFSDRI